MPITRQKFRAKMLNWTSSSVNEASSYIGKYRRGKMKEDLYTARGDITGIDFFCMHIVRPITGVGL